MTKLLEQAFAILQRMPPAAQDEIARALLGMADEADAADIEPEHRAAVMEGVMQTERGEFAARSAEDIIASAFGRAGR